MVVNAYGPALILLVWQLRIFRVCGVLLVRIFLIALCAEKPFAHHRHVQSAGLGATARGLRLGAI